MSRKEAYKELQRLMGMTKGQAHFGNFTKAECERFLCLSGANVENHDAYLHRS